MNTRKLIRQFAFFIALILVQEASYSQEASAATKLNFKDFTVNVKENKINIKWSTDNTVQTNYFEVQKSTDGVNYKTIMLVMGADPMQTNCDCYGCFDKFVAKTSKHCYYRLLHVSADGTVQVSEVKKLSDEKEIAQK